MKVVFDYNQFVDSGDAAVSARINRVLVGSAASICDEIHYQLQRQVGTTMVFVSKSNISYVAEWSDDGRVTIKKITAHEGEVIQQFENFVCACDVLSELLRH